MEKLKEKHEVAWKALQSFKKDLDLIQSKSSVVEEYYAQFRSSSIQSFEFSIDTLWKFAKLYLTEKCSITFDTPNPRLVFQECWRANLMSEAEFNEMIKIVADRNLTSHSYNEQTAEKIMQRLPEHYQLMKKIFDRFEVSQ